MTALDVFRAGVELGVVREVVRALAVGGSGCRAIDVGRIDAAQFLAVVDDVLGALGEGDDLGLAGGKRDAVLFARAPADALICKVEPNNFYMPLEKV